MQQKLNFNGWFMIIKKLVYFNLPNTMHLMDYCHLLLDLFLLPCQFYRSYWTFKMRRFPGNSWSTWCKCHFLWKRLKEKRRKSSRRMYITRKLLVDSSKKASNYRIFHKWSTSQLAWIIQPYRHPRNACT